MCFKLFVEGLENRKTGAQSDRKTAASMFLFEQTTNITYEMATWNPKSRSNVVWKSVSWSLVLDSTAETVRTLLQGPVVHS